MLDAVLGEEHVLGAAQADALGAELAGDLGVARDVRVGAHAELAAELVGPAHELGQNAGGGIGSMRVGLTGEHFTGGAVERNPVAFLQRDGLAADRDAELLLVLVDLRWRRRRRRRAMPMPRATTAAWLVMPPRAVRMPLATSMPWMSSGTVSLRTRMTGAFFGGLHGVVGREDDPADRGAGRGRQAGGDLLQRLLAKRDRAPGAAADRAAAARRAARLLPCRSGLLSTISTAMRTAAGPVRLPLRVCSMYSLPSWMVNSKSCMSR